VPSSEKSVAEPNLARSRRKKWAIWAFQVLVTLTVLAFVGRQIQSALADLQKSGVSWQGIRWSSLGLAGACYFGSLLPAAIFWRLCLVALGNSPSHWRAIRAFLIGGVGKYVPGKAAVVFLRTVLVAGQHCTATSAGVAVFIETLTAMGVGGFLAAIVVAILFREHWLIAILSAGLAAGVILPTIPRVTRLVAQAIRLQRLSGDIHERLTGWNTSLIARGWLLESFNWLLQAFSVWLCLCALPDSFFQTPAQLSAAHRFSDAFPLMLVSTAISTVIGFLLLIPAGLGVREIVVSGILAPVIGGPAATIVSVLSRLVMIIVDVATAAVLYFVPSHDDFVPSAPTP
jgi:glycosyltransferase 2 family protein